MAQAHKLLIAHTLANKGQSIYFGLFIFINFLKQTSQIIYLLLHSIDNSIKMME
ncbi:hypothetical protein P20495_1091 [Pseudoalteromonas sp. BSi20495]|nr:hypothetical protein P20495_1091 [Pseudoalteromonas sp. BSi20495]